MPISLYNRKEKGGIKMKKYISYALFAVLGLWCLLPFSHLEIIINIGYTIMTVII